MLEFKGNHPCLLSIKGLETYGLRVLNPYKVDSKPINKRVQSITKTFKLSKTKP